MILKGSRFIAWASQGASLHAHSNLACPVRFFMRNWEVVDGVRVCLKCGNNDPREWTSRLAKGKKVRNSWGKMVTRCYDPKSSSYPEYGGRGIRVHPAWRKSWLPFVRYLGLPPTKDHSIDRLDNDRGYEPGNVRWATQRQQMRNRRWALTVELDGRRMQFNDACDELGMPAVVRQSWAAGAIWGFMPFRLRIAGESVEAGKGAMNQVTPRCAARTRLSKRRGPGPQNVWRRRNKGILESGIRLVSGLGGLVKGDCTNSGTDPHPGNDPYS
jgi:hypothetical protein